MRVRFVVRDGAQGDDHYALDQARAQMQVCTLYFGRSPYDNVYVTEQPNFTFGQSWPNLVYLPISAYIDSTQRWLLFGESTRSSQDSFGVTPHEVAHQWFGHAVGWASYHDQWLSEGFAEFVGGLISGAGGGTEMAEGLHRILGAPGERVLEKNNFGVSPNDAGPLWMGLRLMSPRTGNAYQGVTYSKGAYVLSMLRSLMRADNGPGDPDQAFMDMMHDFTTTHRDTPASTESFQAIADKHITKTMDLQKMSAWTGFFRSGSMARRCRATVSNMNLCQPTRGNSEFGWKLRRAK